MNKIWTEKYCIVHSFPWFTSSYDKTEQEIIEQVRELIIFVQNRNCNIPFLYIYVFWIVGEPIQFLFVFQSSSGGPHVNGRMLLAIVSTKSCKNQICIYTTFWPSLMTSTKQVFPKHLWRNSTRGWHVSYILIRTHFLCSSWLCCYMAQMNPLIGPVLPQGALFAIQQYWVRDQNQIV